MCVLIVSYQGHRAALPRVHTITEPCITSQLWTPGGRTAYEKKEAKNSQKSIFLFIHHWFAPFLLPPPPSTPDPSGDTIFLTCGLPVQHAPKVLSPYHCFFSHIPFMLPVLHVFLSAWWTCCFRKTSPYSLFLSCVALLILRRGPELFNAFPEGV